MLIELSYRFLGYTGLLEPLGMLMKNRMFAYVALVMALAIGPARVDQSSGQSAAVPQLGAWGFDTSGIDPKAKPGDSFFVSISAVDGQGHESLFAYPEVRCDATSCAIPSYAYNVTAPLPPPAPAKDPAEDD